MGNCWIQIFVDSKSTSFTQKTALEDGDWTLVGVETATRVEDCVSLDGEEMGAFNVACWVEMTLR